MTTTTAISAAAYGEDVDALESWDDLEITTERDGDGSILVDASPAGLDRDAYPMGLPGIGIRVTPDQARALAAALLDAAGDPPLGEAELAECLICSIRIGDVEGDDLESMRCFDHPVERD